MRGSNLIQRHVAELLDRLTGGARKRSRCSGGTSAFGGVGGSGEREKAGERVRASERLARLSRGEGHGTRASERAHGAFLVGKRVAGCAGERARESQQERERRAAVQSGAAVHRAREKQCAVDHRTGIPWPSYDPHSQAVFRVPHTPLSSSSPSSPSS